MHVFDFLLLCLFMTCNRGLFAQSGVKERWQISSEEALHRHRAPGLFSFLFFSFSFFFLPASALSNVQPLGCESADL